jgi:hypothetical protein
MAVRGAGAASMTQFRWSAFVLIACNKGCLPQIDATDTAFLNRMVSVPMRAKFNDAVAAAGDEPHSFPMDVHVQEKLVDVRMAVMHASWRRGEGNYVRRPCQAATTCTTSSWGASGLREIPREQSMRQKNARVFSIRRPTVRAFYFTALSLMMRLSPRCSRLEVTLFVVRAFIIP